MLLSKLQRLGSAASWDSCGGVKQKSLRKAKIPAEFSNFVHDCSGTSENCRLMKVLQSNKCLHDCKYCINSSPSGKKTALEPKELAQSFSFLAKKGYVQGLFLSSAVQGNAGSTAEKMIESARLLRSKANFPGYIHLKVLPAMSRDHIYQMAELADRLSLNIEAPSKEFFSELGSTKDYFKDLEKRLKWISKVKEKGILRSFTTQLILGAASETDKDVLEKMDSLYKETKLHRTYFSAFEPVKGTPLEKEKAEHSLREHRLYQTDWLLRIYGFEVKELKLALDEREMFSLHRDPKITIAVNSPNKFPLDPNAADREELLHVPGIGPKAAENIETAKEKGKKFTEFKELRECGVIVKRAMPFLALEKERQARIAEYC